MTEDAAKPHEPAFKAPWQSVALPLVLLAAYLAQRTASNAVLAQLALTSQAVLSGRVDTLFTSLFLHGGWAHLFMNASAAIAFGPPVARYLGQGVRGVTLFFLFFLICGALSGLGYVLCHLGGSGFVIGASGGVSGLWGAASRLLARRGALSSLLSRTVVLQGGAFAVVNIVAGLAGGLLAGTGIAWEAHLAGYLAGLLLIGPAGTISGRSHQVELP